MNWSMKMLLSNILTYKFFREISFHFILAFLISASLFLEINKYFDFLLVASVTVYLRNKINFPIFYVLSLFLWGLYADILIGYPIGYTSCIFLFFYILSEFCSLFVESRNIKPRFYIFTLGLLFFLITEYLIIKLSFKVNLSFDIMLIKYFLISLIFYPMCKISLLIEPYNEK